MPETTTIKDQKQFKRIIRRYEMADKVGICVTLLALPFMIVVILFMGDPTIKYPHGFPLLALLSFTLFGIIGVFVGRSIRRKFWENLSPEEETLIQQKMEQNAKQVLLRGSQPEQQDTLLRAATPSADTPQEQLLRPSDDA